MTLENNFKRFPLNQPSILSVWIVQIFILFISFYKFLFDNLELSSQVIRENASACNDYSLKRILSHCVYLVP